MKVNLGDKARDSITGFTGIVVAITQWISGCARVTLQPDCLDKDGKPFAGETFDEDLIVLVKAKKVAEGQHATGGPRPDVATKPSIKR